MLASIGFMVRLQCLLWASEHIKVLLPFPRTTQQLLLRNESATFAHFPTTFHQLAEGGNWNIRALVPSPVGPSQHSAAERLDHPPSLELHLSVKINCRRVRPERETVYTNLSKAHSWIPLCQAAGLLHPPNLHRFFHASSTNPAQSRQVATWECSTEYFLAVRKLYIYTYTCVVYIFYSRWYFSIFLFFLKIYVYWEYFHFLPTLLLTQC